MVGCREGIERRDGSSKREILSPEVRDGGGEQWIEVKQPSPLFLQPVFPIVRPSPTHAQAFQASEAAKGSSPGLADCKLQALSLPPLSPFLPVHLDCTDPQREVGVATCLTLQLVLLLLHHAHPSGNAFWPLTSHSRLSEPHLLLATNEAPSPSHPLF